MQAAGLDPDTLPEHLSAAEATARFGTGPGGERAARWADIWSAGHSASGVHDVPTVAAVVDRLTAEYAAAGPVDAGDAADAADAVDPRAAGLPA